VRTIVRARSTSVPMRFRTILVSGFGLIALCLAVAGIYGVLTYLVGQRTREIGLRMPLGATKGMILRLVICGGAVLAAVGMVLGVLGAIAATRLLGTMLFQVQPYDPLTYAAGLVFLSFVAFVACYIPASRAADIDPLKALRVD
jgi:ABC-type antimicrobial peptide transport system permease subunit